MKKEKSKDIETMLAGRKTPSRKMKYTWRDAALYALAVGAGPGDLSYTFEKGIKVLPMFGSLSCWGALGVEPHLDLPAPAAMYAMEHIDCREAFLQMDHEIVMHGRIEPEGELCWQDEITDVYDRGEGKGIAVRSLCSVSDAKGTLLCENMFTTYFPAGGGFGGKPMPKTDTPVPEREADEEYEEKISPVQNLLFRLTGDTNLVHVDPEYAKGVGVGRPNLQGLCTMGFAARELTNSVAGGEPEKVKRIAARMTGMVFPGDDLILKVWREKDRAVFQMINAETDKVVLDRGVFEFCN